MDDTAQAALDRALAEGDTTALVTLYHAAAEQSTDPTQRAFLLTHAYVHALEGKDPRTEALRVTLVALGAEPVDQD